MPTEPNCTFIISAITLVVAIISPVVVTIANNMHNTKIRKLELKYEKQNSYYNKLQSTFQNYLNAISHQLEEDFKSERIAYLHCYHELFLYIPECYWSDIETLNSFILNRDKENSKSKLNQVTKTLGKILQESALQFPKL